MVWGQSHRLRILDNIVSATAQARASRDYQRNEDANAYGKAKWRGSPESQTTTLTAGLKHLDEIQDQILRQRGQIAAAQESVVEMLAYGAGPVGAAANGVIMATDFMENGLTLSNTANVLMTVVHAKQLTQVFGKSGGRKLARKTGEGALGRGANSIKLQRK